MVARVLGEGSGWSYKREMQGIFVVLELFGIFPIAVATPTNTGDKIV